MMILMLLKLCFPFPYRASLLQNTLDDTHQLTTNYVTFELAAVLVTKAWDEDYDGHVADASSLHREGRALLVKPASGNTVHLATMTQLAICAKADFVQHNGGGLPTE